MNAVDGLIAVSGAYFPPLKAAYPRLEGIPTATIPFGYSTRDFAAARNLRPGAVIAASPGVRTGLSAGRAGKDMAGPLNALMELLRTLIAIDPGAAPHVAFVGTGYLQSGNGPVILPVAGAMGLGSHVTEQPDRLPLLAALKAQLEADFLVLMGSDDLSYQPSKLFLYLATDRPVLCVTPAQGRCAQAVRGMTSVFVVNSDQAVTAEVAKAFAAWLARQGGAGPADPRRAAVASEYSAETLARAECELFDRVVGSQEAGS